MPGAGKALAGLNIANTRHKFEENDHAVFLSGNGPLVEVLQEALARDDAKKNDIPKNRAKTKTKAFIQIIHRFRDAAVESTEPPLEKVAIFDEAQRAWDMEQLSKFMEQKKNVPGFHKSEPESLIEFMDRHQDWATIVCLVGGGQEILMAIKVPKYYAPRPYQREAWARRLSGEYDYYAKIWHRQAGKMTDSEYVGDSSIQKMMPNPGRIWIIIREKICRYRNRMLFFTSLLTKSLLLYGMLLQTSIPAIRYQFNLLY